MIKSGKTLSEYYGILVERHGPVIQMFIGWHMSLVVADRGEAERLMIKFKNVDFPPTVFRMFEPLIPLSIMGLPGKDTWKHHRRVMGPTMNRRFLTRMEPHVLEMARQLVNLWDRKHRIVGDRAFAADLDLGLASMVRRRNCARSSEANILVFGLSELLGRWSSLDPLDRIPASTTSVEKTNESDVVDIPVKSSTPMFDGIRNLMTKVGAIIEAKKREVNHGALATDAESVLDMLLLPDPRDGTEQFDEKELLDELAAFLIAGSTVGKVLAWFVKYMPKDAEIQRQLHNEMRTVFDANKEDTSKYLADLNDPDKVPILEAVMAETLRCAQVTSATVRSREWIIDNYISDFVFIPLFG
ncbi:Cytochrome P450 [Rhizoctonia solani]|uniref:Cytochrome P450 n=1 Tax=Rhizoctonia solani TaxID=456999 RepID=A0A8H7M1B2_9AGAM|nr:Cytochrome P450 [Rhizoctonia solani]